VRALPALGRSTTAVVLA
jgi:hypothetical protein